MKNQIQRKIQKALKYFHRLLSSKVPAPIRQFPQNSVLVESITSEQLRVMLIQATYKLEEHQSFLDQINVYPVPDGDTGSNLVHTMNAVRKELEKKPGISFVALSQLVSRTAVINARGNIGIIVSQFLNGFMGAFEKVQQAEIKHVCQAFWAGEKSAFDALDDPKSGTVLDIFSAASDAARLSSNRTQNITDLMDVVLDKSQTALEKTRNILPQMQKAQVVDAGGAGFLYLLGGFVAFLKKSEVIISEDIHPSGISIVEEEELKYRFCTECVIKNPSITINQLKKKIEDLGNSTHVVGSGDIIKMHIHTNEPEQVKELCSSLGQIEDWKVDDMDQMQKDKLKKYNQSKRQAQGESIAIVTDSSIDYPLGWQDGQPIFEANIPIFLSDDKRDISQDHEPDDYYAMMSADGNFLPKTSQPNPQQFFDQIQQALKVADRVFCLPISSRLSSTYKSAIQARKMLPDAQVHVIDTYTTSVGLAIMARSVLKQARQGKDMVDITTSLYEMRDEIYIYFVVADLNYLQRSGRISKSKTLLGNILGMQPILSLQQGKIEPTGEKIIFANADKSIRFLKAKLESHNSTKTVKEMYIIHTGAEKEARDLQNLVDCDSNFKSLHVEIMPISKVLGSHLGPGALGILFN